MRTRMMKVANSTPKARPIAIGTMKRACKDCSKIIGSSPKKVVSEVNKMGRKRRMPPSTAA